MSTQSDSIFNAAMQLPELERMEIVSRLLESFPENTGGIDLDDPQLEAELDRRFAETEGMVPWQTLKDSG